MVLVEVVLGASFLSLMYLGYLRAAGILEWTVTFLGCLYVWAFIGFVA
jgi:hypothetical protein